MRLRFHIILQSIFKVKVKVVYLSYASNNIHHPMQRNSFDMARRFYAVGLKTRSSELRISKSASRSYCMSDSAERAEIKTKKTVISQNLHRVSRAIVHATILYGAQYYVVYNVTK
ncbi:hypothetical protein UPYG_G00285510 [Umbra pygmaea]|uniref:Uncharacterized protein n=1 Tax=Umbra pygmaea TaxID=75934 RepID=A0ABD0WNB2_UMBPY